MPGDSPQLRWRRQTVPRPRGWLRQRLPVKGTRQEARTQTRRNKAENGDTKACGS
jgi:hypothetical protein